MRTADRLFSRLPGQLLSHPGQNRPLPAGDLHLSHAQKIRCRLLSAAVEVPLDDQGPILRRKFPEHLAQSDSIRDPFLRRGHRHIDLIPLLFLPRTGERQRGKRRLASSCTVGSRP